MIRELWERIWRDPDASLQKQLRREQAAQSERRRRDELDTDEKRKDREDNTDLLMLLIVSEAIRRQQSELAADIESAISAARHAYARAVLERDKAGDNLAEAQRHALVLHDGRRVYFSRDGALRNEDGEHLGDPGTLEEAVRLRQAQPQATTYETLVAKNSAVTSATERMQHLAEALDHLDGLREQARSGTCSPEQISAARAELDRIVDSLPEEGRDEYIRLRDARTSASAVPHVDAGPVLTSAPNVAAQFARAEAAFVSSTENQELETNRPPTYKPVDF